VKKRATTIAEHITADLPLRMRPIAHNDDIDDRCVSVPLRTK
jgi:hypothetical protein